MLLFNSLVFIQNNSRALHKTTGTMATIAELLASSLDVLKQVQQNGDFMIVKSGDLSYTHIRRLV